MVKKLKFIYLLIMLSLNVSVVFCQQVTNLLFQDTFPAYAGTGYSDYRIVGLGRDSSTDLFYKRDKIVLIKEQYTPHSKLRFCSDSTFEFNYGPKRLFGEMRAYYKDDNGYTVHTNDTMSWIGYHSMKGEYTIGEGGIISILITEYTRRGEWPAMKLGYAHGPFRYWLLVRDNKYILNKVKD